MILKDKSMPYLKKRLVPIVTPISYLKTICIVNLNNALLKKAGIEYPYVIFQ